MVQPPSDETRIQPDGRPPEQFGRYRIRQMLGQGAMGRVYLAEDVPLGRRVALKIPTLREGDSSELLDRFYREARSAGGLNHPKICPVYDVGEIDGVHYIAMANIEGRPLSDLLASNKPLAERQAMILVQKLAHALQEAHNHRIVHRDLKPSNIMLDAGDEPIITDFGLAPHLPRRRHAAHSQRDDPGFAGLHVARASPRRPRHHRTGLGSIQPGSDSVPVADGPRSLSRLVRRDDATDSQRSAHAAEATSS